MKLSQNSAALWLLSLIVLTVSCGGNKDNPEQDGSVPFESVQFSVPDKLEIEYGAPVISFRVQFSKSPKNGDLLALGSLPDCAIKNITSASFDVDISALWEKGLSSGTYNVTLKRGASSRKMGETLVSVTSGGGNELTPSSGSTVYGVVSCAGKGVANVVVSDGVECVKTDADGVYQLKSAKYYGYVFVSVPSGYEPYAQGILPLIHASLSKPSSVAERVDFQLSQVSGQENHTMLILGDIHLANRTGDRAQFSTFVSDINQFRSSLPGPVYGLTLGDMTWDLYWKSNNYGYRNYLDDANRIQNLTVYHTIGNHDHSMFEIGDFNTVEEYREVIGPTYYSFNIGGVHYVVLDDVLCTNGSSGQETDSAGNVGYKRTYDAKIDDTQFAWLQKDLSYVPASTPIVVAMHIPLYKAGGGNNMDGASRLATLLGQYPEVHVYTAHTHTVYNVDKSASNHIFEHNSGAVCATWWWSNQETPGIHIGQDGSPGGYAVLSVGDGFSWQYKATGSPVDYQFRCYDRNEICITKEKYYPSATNASYIGLLDADIWGTQDSSNEVYINVWDWDPSWTVEVTENGSPLSVSRVTVNDPLHLIAYTAKRVNKNSKPTFATTGNSHTFKVTASSASSTLDIKVTDRFGNEYTETMTRPRAFSTDTYKH